SVKWWVRLCMSTIWELVTVATFRVGVVSPAAAEQEDTNGAAAVPAASSPPALRKFLRAAPAGAGRRFGCLGEVMTALPVEPEGTGHAPHARWPTSTLLGTSSSLPPVMRAARRSPLLCSFEFALHAQMMA